MTSPDDVLEFWLGAPATDEATLNKKLQRWFNGGPAVDDEIRARFGDLHERAVRGELDDWADTPRGRRALIVVLDQFTRNLGRGTRAAYSGDRKAQLLAVQALDQGEDQGLSFEELLFLTMPLAHSEKLEMHDRNLALLEKYVAERPEAERARYASSVAHQRKYREQIAQFGRFPHRNAILERTCTQEEWAFLASPSRNG